MWGVRVSGKGKSLCPHVEIAVDKSSDPPVVTATGAVYPYFSWDVSLQADIPRLKCSACGRAVKIMGYAVKRSRPFLGGDPS